MSVSANSFPVSLAWVVLLVVHTAVTLGAYRWLAKSTVIWKYSDSTIVETTTAEQEARGESSFTTREEVVVGSTVPIPVLCYVYAGYAGLGLAALIGFIGWIRQSLA
jgi:hypothetical protein